MSSQTKLMPEIANLLLGKTSLGWSTDNYDDNVYQQ
jgi:hypothetical protein